QPIGHCQIAVFDRAMLRAMPHRNQIHLRSVEKDEIRRDLWSLSEVHANEIRTAARRLTQNTNKWTFPDAGARRREGGDTRDCWLKIKPVGQMTHAAPPQAGKPVRGATGDRKF